MDVAWEFTQLSCRGAGPTPELGPHGREGTPPGRCPRRVDGRAINLPVVMLATELEGEVSVLNQGPNAMTGVLEEEGLFHTDTQRGGAT